jgi:hypothetical protein
MAMTPATPPTLHYEAAGNQWVGEDEEIDVLLTDQALQREIDAYMAARGMFADQRGEALRLLRTVKFWQTYAGAGGVDIVISRKPRSVRERYYYGRTQ